MLQCPGIIPRSCQTRIVAGRSGYEGEPQAKAIVLHVIEGLTAEAFENQINSPLPTFCAQFSNNPKSVHFAVTDTAKIQYAEISSTTYGLDYLYNSTWPGLAALVPIENVNGPFIHVALLTDQLNPNLTELLCCIQLDVGVNLPILAASDLQCDRPLLEINPTLLENVKLCTINGGVIDPPNIFDLEDRVEELERCCLENTLAVSKLRTRVSKLERNDRLQDKRLDILDGKVDQLFDIVAIIPALEAQILILIQQVQGIIDRCCPLPDPSAQRCFHYQLLPGDEMVITPNQPIHINLPTKIEDTTPPIVLTGPLWRAQLLGNCPWTLEGIVRLRLAQWCAGKQFKLTLSVCGVMYPMGTWTAPTTGVHQAFVIINETPIPAGCNNVFLYASINDDTAKIIEFAQFKGCGCLL